MIAASFQFHEGPIKTVSRLLLDLDDMKFQFHEGPIKTGHAITRISAWAQFQFHEGPIKTFLQQYNGYFKPVSIPWRSD